MNILCGCGELARLQTSWTQNNPARKFLGCPDFMDPIRNCNFFRWIDPQLPNRWYQERMYELHLNVMNTQQQLLEVNLRFPFSRYVKLQSFFLVVALVLESFVVAAFVVAPLVVVVALVIGALVLLDLVLLLGIQQVVSGLMQSQTE
ncbi:zinc finger, GRF-type containing protein [Tanacetum coccineum]